VGADPRGQPRFDRSSDEDPARRSSQAGNHPARSRCQNFNPSATGGEPLRSLGHPFITRYVVNEFRRTERELAQGQLSLLFVERAGPPLHVFGSKVLPTEPEQPPATPESIAQGRAEFERMAAASERPARG
jgi:hypothetical protein